MMNIVCFHNADEDNGYLSNWYHSEFIVDGIAFSSMEQYMMYKKAVCFKDAIVAAQILETDNASSIKELGRLVSGYDDNYWSDIRQIVVYQGRWKSLSKILIYKINFYLPVMQF